MIKGDAEEIRLKSVVVRNQVRAPISFPLTLLISIQMFCLAEDAGHGAPAVQPKKTVQVPAENKPRKFDDEAWQRKPLPSQKMLDDVLKNLKSVRVIDCGLDLIDGKPYAGGDLTGKVFFKFSDSKTLKEFSDFLRIRESDKNTSCFYGGAPTCELTLADGRIVRLLWLYGGLIRWHDWKYDVHLQNPRGFMRWLTAHGVTGLYREEQEQREYNRREYEGVKPSLEEFVRTAPKSLRMFFRTEPTILQEVRAEQYKNITEEQLLKLAKLALNKQFPSVDNQIGVLFDWEGKLTHTDNHHFSLNSFPTKLLLNFDQGKVLKWIRVNSLSSTQWVGVSRYYSSGYFERKFPSGYNLLDEKLRSRIRRGVKATGKNKTDLENFKEFETRKRI